MKAVTKNSIFPIYTNGFFLSRNQATASIIRYKNKEVIITAAHSVFDRETKSIYKNIRVKKNPVSTMIVHKEWTERGNFLYDIAFLLPKKEDEFKLRKNRNMTIGYLNHDDLCCELIGLSLYKQKFKTYKGKIKQDKIYNSGLIGVKARPQDGLSGGPWIRELAEHDEIIAITSLSLAKYPEMLWGVPITKPITKMIDELIEGKSTDSVIFKLG